MIEGKSREQIRQEEVDKWEEMSLKEHMDFYEKQGIDRKEAMKRVAKDRGICGFQKRLPCTLSEKSLWICTDYIVTLLHPYIHIHAFPFPDFQLLFCLI